jgi:transposase
LKFFGTLYAIERDIADFESEARRAVRQERAKPVADMLHKWMIGQRERVPDGSAIMKALDYSLKRWQALTRYLDDGAVPIDNNWVENQIRPWAIGRSYAQSSIMLSCRRRHPVVPLAGVTVGCA